MIVYHMAVKVARRDNNLTIAIDTVSDEGKVVLPIPLTADQGVIVIEWERVKD